MEGQTDLLARLASAVAGAPEHESFTWRLCEATRRLLGADGASLTVDNASTNRITLCATDEVAAQLENLHDVLGEGPATSAYLTGEPVVVTLAQAAERWPMFAESATRQTGAGQLYALPMRQGFAVQGVLTLYRRTAGPLSEDEAAAQFLADALAAALLQDAGVLSDLGPGGSWSNRAQVHQATGMVVAQLAVGVRDALAILRAHAFALDQPLAQVAQAVVAREPVFRRSDDGGARTAPT
ncbi:GAF and ANTAR domain-containing protein [Cellulomonas sp. NS3]|uniref:GAF and ANTAR domain-containing protein n=1 Tax=Cellulomonas sp. NS3 TaxID=2973977 RepID=UPI0021615B1C|nr:GAF and ANTAR domain-containing protein [Cellulomonas sp. NS3]